MQAFIRLQMHNIMRPVAEHVREVQAQVQQLTKRLNASDLSMEESRLCMEQQHGELFTLRKGLAQTDTHVEKVQNDLGTTHREKDRLGVDHETTKSDLAKLAGDLRTTNILMKDLQQKYEDLHGGLRSLRAGSEKTNRTLAQEAEKTAQIKELVDGLSSRHSEAAKSAEDLTRSGADIGRDLQKLSAQCEKTNASTSADVASLRDHINSVERRLGSTQLNAQTNSDAIRHIEAQLRLLKGSVSSYDGGSDRTAVDASRATALEQRPDGASRVSSDVDGLKASLSKLRELFSHHKDDHLQLIKDLDRRVSNNSSRMDDLHSAKEHMGEHLRKNDAFLAKAQLSLDALGGQVEHLQHDVRGLHASQTDLTNQLNVQRIVVAKTQTDLKRLDGLADAANDNFLHLKEGIANVDGKVSNLGSRYDNCSRNIHGVSRGLADVGKHVAQGDHGLLPPMSPHSRRLPSIGLGNSGHLEGALPSAR